MNGSLLELNLTQLVAASCSTAESIHNDGLSLFPNFKPDPFAPSRRHKKYKKVCVKCKQLLPINQFKKKAKKSGGRFKVCHSCWADLNSKVCVKCKRKLPYANFPKAKSNGHWRVCFDCVPLMSNAPSPQIRCAQCLYGIGFGYGRISVKLFGSEKQKHLVSIWKQRHSWTCDFDSFKCFVNTIRKPKPPKPPKPDPMYVRKKHRLKVYLRAKVWMFLKHGLHPKSTATLIGCNRPQFLAYLTPLMQPGMTFQNYGPIWHIDHKIPCKFFNLFDLDQRSLCFHYTNLQPMFAHENRTKSASMPAFDALHGSLTTLKLLALAAQREFPFQ